MVGKKSTHVIYECSQREADESVLSAETSSSSGLGKEEKPSKYRLIDATKYYIVEEDVSDDEDIDPKHYQTPTYQRSVNKLQSFQEVSYTVFPRYYSQILLFIFYGLQMQIVLEKTSS